MTITRETRNYQLVISYGVDGKIAVYRQTMTTIKDDDTVLITMMDPPEMLKREQLQPIISALTDSDWFVPVGSEVTE